MGRITPPSRPFESEHRGSMGRKIPTHRRTNSRICLSVWDVFHAQIECDRVVCTWYLVWPPTTQWRVCSSKSHICNESHMSNIKSIKSEIIRLLVEDINLVPPTTQSWVFQHYIRYENQYRMSNIKLTKPFSNPFLSSDYPASVLHCLSSVLSCSFAKN